MKNNLMKIIRNNLHDIFILSGLVIFILSMFIFVSTLVGCLSLSFILVLLGIALAKIKKQ